MDAVKSFNGELTSLYEARPPISKAKMTSITKGAIKAIKFYKHVVQSVEKFIQKCKPEYKIPGLYVIDSIVRQSRHQFGSDKDVFAMRFAKNAQVTFFHLYMCSEEEKSKVIRVLNLWQKNAVFPSEVIQPLFDMANPDSDIQRKMKEEYNTTGKLTVKSPKFSSEGRPRSADRPSDGGSNGSMDQHTLQQLKTIQQLLQNPPTVKFNKKLLDFDYGSDEEDNDQDQGPSLATLEALQGILGNTAVLAQLKSMGAINQQQINQLQQLLPNLTAQLSGDHSPGGHRRSPSRHSQYSIPGLGQTTGFNSPQPPPPNNYNQYPDMTLPPPAYPTQHGMAPPPSYPPGQGGYQRHGGPTRQSPLEEGEHAGGDTDEDAIMVIDDQGKRSRERDRGRRSRSRDGRRSRSRSGSRKSKKRRDKSRSRSRDRGRRRRSRSKSRERRKEERQKEDEARERGRKEKAKEEEEKEKEKERLKEREKKGLPTIKLNHLSVCSSTLWVGHLSKLVAQEDLSDLFGQYGEVVSIDVIPPRGCAFVHMNRRMDASRALKNLNKFRMHGKQITMAWAPGKGMKDKQWKEYWDVDFGVSYIPIDKLDPQVNMAELEEGGMFDDDTMPEWMKTMRGVAPGNGIPGPPGFIPVPEGMPPGMGPPHELMGHGPPGGLPPGMPPGMPPPHELMGHGPPGMPHRGPPGMPPHGDMGMPPHGDMGMPPFGHLGPPHGAPPVLGPPHGAPQSLLGQPPGGILGQPPGAALLGHGPNGNPPMLLRPGFPGGPLMGPPPGFHGFDASQPPPGVGMPGMGGPPGMGPGGPTPGMGGAPPSLLGPPPGGHGGPPVGGQGPMDLDDSQAEPRSKERDDRESRGRDRGDRGGDRDRDRDSRDRGRDRDDYRERDRDRGRGRDGDRGRDDRGGRGSRDDRRDDRGSRDDRRDRDKDSRFGRDDDRRDRGRDRRDDRGDRRNRSPNRGEGEGGGNLMNRLRNLANHPEAGSMTDDKGSKGSTGGPVPLMDLTGPDRQKQDAARSHDESKDGPKDGNEGDKNDGSIGLLGPSPGGPGRPDGPPENEFKDHDAFPAPPAGFFGESGNGGRGGGPRGPRGGGGRDNRGNEEFFDGPGGPPFGGQEEFFGGPGGPDGFFRGRGGRGRGRGGFGGQDFDEGFGGRGGGGFRGGSPGFGRGFRGDFGGRGGFRGRGGQDGPFRGRGRGGFGGPDMWMDEGGPFGGQMGGGPGGPFGGQMDGPFGGPGGPMDGPMDGPFGRHNDNFDDRGRGRGRGRGGPWEERGRGGRGRGFGAGGSMDGPDGPFDGPGVPGNMDKSGEGDTDQNKEKGEKRDRKGRKSRWGDQEEGLLGAPPGDDGGPPGESGGPPGEDGGQTGERGTGGESGPPGGMNEVDGSSVEPTMGDASESTEGGDLAPADVHKKHVPDDAPVEDMFADAGPVNPPADVGNLHDEFNNKDESNREQEQYDESEESFPEPVMACPQTPPPEPEAQKDGHGTSEAVEDAYEDKEESFGNGGDGEPSESQDEVGPDEY